MTLKSGLEVTQDHSNSFESLGLVSCSPSVVTMVLSCISCEMKQDIGQKLLFFHTRLHSTSPLGGSPSEYCHPVWSGKTRMVGLPDGEKTLRICVTGYRHNTGVWQTDGETDGHLARAQSALRIRVRRTEKNKKLSCRRETAERFASLNNLLSHKRSLKVIRNNTVE